MIDQHLQSLEWDVAAFETCSLIVSRSSSGVLLRCPALSGKGSRPEQVGENSSESFKQSGHMFVFVGSRSSSRRGRKR